MSPPCPVRLCCWVACRLQNRHQDTRFSDHIVKLLQLACQQNTQICFFIQQEQINMDTPEYFFLFLKPDECKSNVPFRPWFVLSTPGSRCLATHLTFFCEHSLAVPELELLALNPVKTS